MKHTFQLLRTISLFFLYKLGARVPHLSQKLALCACAVYNTMINYIVIFQTDFEWNGSQRASVLGSFYWLHWVLQLPGGLLARQYGAKCIFGLSNLFMFVMSLLMPVLARWDIKGLIVARVLQGLVGVRDTLCSYFYAYYSYYSL